MTLIKYFILSHYAEYSIVCLSTVGSVSGQFAGIRCTLPPPARVPALTAGRRALYLTLPWCDSDHPSPLPAVPGHRWSGRREPTGGEAERGPGRRAVRHRPHLVQVSSRREGEGVAVGVCRAIVGVSHRGCMCEDFRSVESQMEAVCTSDSHITLRVEQRPHGSHSGLQ